MERILRKVLPKASISFVEERSRKSRQDEQGEKQADSKEEVVDGQMPESKSVQYGFLVWYCLCISIWDM